MAKLIPPLPAFHRHICTLQAFAAVCARSQLDRESSEFSDEMRGKLCISLLDWCDNFYDSLTEWSRISLISIPDAVWMPPTSALRYVGYREFQDHISTENIAVFVHILHHIEWGTFPSDRKHPHRAIAKWLIHYLPIYADAALYERCECRPMFLGMLTRIFKHPRISHSLTVLVTRILLTGGIPAFVRDHICQLLPSFPTILAQVISMTKSALDKLSVAISAGDLEFIRNQPDDTLIITNWPRLMEEACYACDDSMFHCLWIFRTRLRINNRETFLGILTAALCASNHNALGCVFVELNDRGLDFTPWSRLFWGHTHNTTCASILIEYGCPLSSALFSVADPATVTYLLRCGAPISPPSVAVAGDAISYDVDIAHMLCAAWTTAGLPTHEYLCAAISVCEDPLVLRELVRMHELVLRASSGTSSTSDPVSTDPISYTRLRCIDHALLSSRRVPDVRLVKACLHLGADINAQDAQTGRSALMNAIVSANTPVIRFLLCSGASATLRDNSGLTALDHYVSRNLRVPGLREKLIERMQASGS